MSEYYNSPVESVNGPFYLRPEGKCSDDAGATWYLNVFVGHNTLGNTVKRLCRDAGITGNKTNHCLRATTGTRGLDVGVPRRCYWKEQGIVQFISCSAISDHQKNKRQWYGMLLMMVRG